MEILHNRHKKKSTVILVGIGIAVIIFLLGLNVGNKQASSGDGTSLTGYAIASLKSSSASDIPLKIDASVDMLELPVQSDLEIFTTNVVIETSDSTIRITNENQVSLKEFKGKMYWNNSMLTIVGKAKQYFGQNTNIDWTKVKKVKLDVLQGSVDVKEFEMDDLEMLPQGTVEVDNDLIQIENKKLVLSDFIGHFAVSLNDSQVHLSMEGNAKQVRILGEDYSIIVK